MGMKCNKIWFEKQIVYLYAVFIQLFLQFFLRESFYLLLQFDCFVYTKYIECDLCSAPNGVKYCSP